MRRSEIAVAMTSVKGNVTLELMDGADAARAEYTTPQKAPFLPDFRLTQRPGHNDPWVIVRMGTCTLTPKCRYRSQVLPALRVLSEGNTRRAPQISPVTAQPSYHPKQEEQGPEKLRNLPKVTQPGEGRSRIPSTHLQPQSPIL